MRCPICGSKLEKKRFVEEIWGSYDEVEKYEKCLVCKLYENKYVYGNTTQRIYKRQFEDERKHKIYIYIVKILYRLGVITNDYNNNKTNEL